MNFLNNNNLQSRFLQRIFRKVEGLVWDLTSGKMGIQTKDGIYTCDITTAEDGTVTAGISVNPFDGFNLPIPAFAQNTAFDQVAVGDIVIGDTKVLGWVVEKKTASLVLLDQGGMTKQYNPPKDAIMNQSGVMVVKSLTGLLGDGNTASLQNALLPLLVLGGDNASSSLDKVLPLLLLTQQNGGNPQSLSGILPLLLLSGNGNSGSMEKLLPLMLMQGGLGGAQGNNGLASLLPLLALSGNGGSLLDSIPVGNAPTLVRTR